MPSALLDIYYQFLADWCSQRKDEDVEGSDAACAIFQHALTRASDAVGALLAGPPADPMNSIMEILCLLQCIERLPVSVPEWTPAIQTIRDRLRQWSAANTTAGPATTAARWFFADIDKENSQEQSSMASASLEHVNNGAYTPLTFDQLWQRWNPTTTTTTMTSAQ